MAVAIDLKQAWIDERSKGIGASEVGTILGLNPFDSAYALWLRKTGQLPPQEETLPMKLGHLMEPVLHRLYEDQTGRSLVDPGEYQIVAHPDYPWLRCTPDRLVQFEDGEQGAVELKTANINMTDEWSEGEAPLAYQAQLQIQLACLGLMRGEIAGLIGNTEFLILSYERNDEFLDAIIPVLHEFWECVQRNEAPMVDGTEATAKALRALHPMDNGETVEIDAEVVEAWAELQELKSMVKEAQDEMTRRENIVKAALRDNTFGAHDGQRLFSWKAQTRKSYTVAETTFRVLRKVGK